MKKSIFIAISILFVIIESCIFILFYVNKTEASHLGEHKAFESFPPNYPYLYRIVDGYLTEMEYNNVEMFLPNPELLNQCSAYWLKGNSAINKVPLDRKTIEEAINECKDKSFIHSNNKRLFTKDTLVCYALDELNANDYREVGVYMCSDDYYDVQITLPNYDKNIVFYDKTGSTVALIRGD